MQHFYPATIEDIKQETSDCVSVSFSLGNENSDLFKFTPGQYITFRTLIRGEEVRRSYSICSAPSDGEIRVAIKKVPKGIFSTFANEHLRVGQMIEVMPPQGHFTRKKEDQNNYVAFAAGSGITPMLSLIKSILESDDDTQFTLFYGNKATDQIIFRETLEALKNIYVTRFQVHYLLSQEVQESELFSGRIDESKVTQFGKYLFSPKEVDQYFVCGPEKMIWSVKEALEALGVEEEKISFELFTTSTKQDHEAFQGNLESSEENNDSQVTVILDGLSFDFPLGYKGKSILDAALAKGADLPFACKGGVCCTCKAKLLDGEVEMEVNYGLEPDEVENGMILTCQSHPRSPNLKIDFDV